MSERLILKNLILNILTNLTIPQKIARVTLGWHLLFEVNIYGSIPLISTCFLQGKTSHQENSESNISIKQLFNLFHVAGHIRSCEGKWFFKDWFRCMGGSLAYGLAIAVHPALQLFGLKNRGLCKRCTIGEIHLHPPFGTRRIGSNDSVFLGGKIYAIALVCTLSRIIVMEVYGSGKWPYLKGNYYWRGLFFNFHDHGRKGYGLEGNLIFVTCYDLLMCEL